MYSEKFIFLKSLEEKRNKYTIQYELLRKKQKKLGLHGPIFRHFLSAGEDAESLPFADEKFVTVMQEEDKITNEMNELRKKLDQVELNIAVCIKKGEILQWVEQVSLEKEKENVGAQKTTRDDMPACR